MKKRTLQALSMFAGGGIAETYFEEIGISVALANELVPERANFYKHLYPKTKMICGDIGCDNIFEEVMSGAEKAGVTFLLATPPCQGMSTLGKREYESDTRNSLVQYVIKAIKRLLPDYVLIENVPKFSELLYNVDGTIYFPKASKTEKPYYIADLLELLFSDQYTVDMKFLNAMHYGVPQSRPRVIIKLYKKGLWWPWPKEEQGVITLQEAIGDLPSLESGETSKIKWHNALKHNMRQVEALRHTPEGKSAMKNEIHFPKKTDGSKVRGFHNTYNRMRWDEPAPARTTNNHLMSGHNNVHPGRLLPDGTWSDARVLTLRELLIVSSLPADWDIPDDFPETKIRTIIGEAIPPLLSRKIVETIQMIGGVTVPYNRSSSREKWTIMMYMRSFDLMVTYAYALRASNELSNDNIDDILLQMEEDGVYHPRNGGSTFTGQFKSIQIAWYMFGYYNKSRNKTEPKKMVFSPLGNLLLDHLKERDKVAKIFLTMLFGNGFRQPFSQMDERFNIFAYRLIFKLLRDSRLEGKLYHDEVFYYAMFMKTSCEASYERLVHDILAFRTLDPYHKLSLFKKDERVVGLACHEWRYATGMLESAGIVTVCNDHGNRVIGRLTYGNISKTTGKPNAIRSYTEDYIVINPLIAEYADQLLSSYSCFEKPYPDDEITRKFNSAIVVEMYSFYPPELLSELGMDTETDQAIATMLSMANDVNYYAREEISTGENFEYALANAFNLFMDVEAERIGGAGNADIECIYLSGAKSHKKFDIEAKSTTRKLQQINSSRLKAHRKKIGSQYTMIVTPNYSIGVLRDIEGDHSVLIKSATLANYLYQYILRSGRNISYAFLDKIIENNIGLDITDKVNEYVYSNYGHEAKDLRIAAKTPPSRDSKG